MYLMEKNGERMNVPPDKLDAYLEKGWKVLKTPQENKNVVVDQPVVSVETPAVEPEPVVRENPAKTIAKKYGKKE